MMKGPRKVRAVLGDLQLLPETVLVIRNDALVTEEEMVADEDTIEIRPVISGGAGRPDHVDRHSGAAARAV